MRNGYLTGYKCYINDQEVQQILGAVEGNIVWSLIFNIMAFMGLRTIEVVRIKYADILGDCFRLRIKLAKCKKIKERIIPNRIKPIFKKYLEVFKGQGHEYLFFPNSNCSKNLHIQTSSVRWKLKNIRHDLGLCDKYYKNLERVRCHAFRHYFLTRFYRLSDHDIVATQETIGHVKLETTAAYITVDDIEQKIAAII